MHPHYSHNKHFKQYINEMFTMILDWNFEAIVMEIKAMVDLFSSCTDY